MKTKNKILDQLIKSVITITILLTISLLILITLYDFEFTYQNVSNALFIPNIIIFIISIGVNIGAGNIFNPLKYTAKRIFSRKNKEEPKESYLEYLEQKEIKKKNNKMKEPWFITFSSVCLLIIAYIFTKL